MPGINKAAEKKKSWLSVVWISWSAVLLVYYLGYLPAIWQGSSNIFSPVCMLLLGAWGTRKGKAACAGVGAVLMILVLLLFGGIGLAAAEEIKWNCALENGMAFRPSAVAAYLLPGVVSCLGDKTNEYQKKWYLMLPVLGTALCVLVRGIVPHISAEKIGIMELGRSVEMFGRVMRLEAITAMGLTISVYCIVNMLLSSIDCCAVKIGAGKKDSIQMVVTIAVIMGMLGKITITDEFAACGSLICWVLAPLGAQLIGSGKKLKNNEKRA